MASKIREKRLAASKRYREKNRKLLAKKAREYQKANPDIYRQAAIKHYHKNRLKILARRYRVTEAEISNLPACCEICSSTIKLCVDHCHISNTVRGMLCDSCNRALGFLKEDTARLASAIAYLDKHKHLKLSTKEGEYAEPKPQDPGDDGQRDAGQYNSLYNVAFDDVRGQWHTGTPNY